MALLSIIITHYKTPELLKDCIRAIKKDIQDIDYQIIVVDSQSTEENQKMIRDVFPEALFLSSKKNIGFSRAVNQGIKKTEGEYLLIMNADVIIKDKETVKEKETVLKMVTISVVLVTSALTLCFW